MNSTTKYKKFVVETDGQQLKHSYRYYNYNERLLVIACCTIVVVMLLVGGIASAVWFGAVHASRSNDAEGYLSDDTTVTPTDVNGEYDVPGSAGIRFQSTINNSHFHLAVTGTGSNGAPIISIMNSLLLNMTVLSINGTNNFVIMKHGIKYDDYIIPDEEAMNMSLSVVMGEHPMTPGVIHMCDNSTVNETRHHVWQSLAMSKEAVLIVKVAMALGYGMEVQGPDNPAAMKFYQLAKLLMNIRRQYDDDDSFVDNIKPPPAHSSKFKRRQDGDRVQCTAYDTTCSESTPCPYKTDDNDCFGMCGYECHCWKFLCGDCCVHNYCRTHDKCCSERGFGTPSCFSAVYDFFFNECDDEFECT